MALLQRLFQNRKNARQYNGSYYGQAEPSNGNLRLPKLDKNKIRLLIIGDTDKGRVPYFDSDAIHRVEEKPSEQFQRVGSDVKLLEEMMFGAVPMTYKGSTLKVHSIRSPPQLMVTKVFNPQKPQPESVSDLDSDSSSLPSSYTDQMASGEFSTPQRKVKNTPASSIPVDVPLVRESFLDSMDDDSGLASLTSSGSFQPLFPSPSNSSASSYNSLHRRWMRSQTTSLLQRCWDSQETLNSPDSSQLPKKKKHLKLAIGILFSVEDDPEELRLFQSFFFAHVALVEGHVEQLRCTVEKAIFTGRNMVPTIYEALDKFRDALYDLYMAQRLREPVWLSMMSLGSYRYVLCERFVHDFMALAAKYDNKSTKFFVSTLLSAVLTYHLAWVATVTPGDGTPSQTYLDKHSAKWIDALAKTHPYNPLWAQLGDLYGAIGHPLKVARTVVVGKKADIVRKFLYVLSYFIRCSDVHEASYSTPLASIMDGQIWEDSTPNSIRGGSVDESGAASPVELHPGIHFRAASFSRSLPPTPSEADNNGSSSSVSSSSKTGSTVEATGLCSSNSRSELSVDARLLSNNKSDGALSPKRTVNFEMHDLVLNVGESCVHRTRSEENCTCNSSRVVSDELGTQRVPSSSDTTLEQIHRSEHHTSLSDQTYSHKTEHGASSACRMHGHKFDENAPVPKSCDQCRSLKNKASGAESDSSEHFQDSKGSGADVENFEHCRVSTLDIVEHSRMENIKHVQRSTDSLHQVDILPPDSDSAYASLNPESLNMDNKSDTTVKQRVKSSMLSQQLAADKEASSNLEQQKARMKEVQKQFLSGGSTSWVDEYFEGGAEIKTIDMVSEDQRVIKHPLACSSASSGDSGVTQTKTSVSRQNSVDVKPHVARPTQLNPARCRSVTPTELERRRHLSSTSSVDMDTFDPLLHCQEISLPGLKTQGEQSSIEACDQNFGRSLLASYSDHYMSDFVLHGTSDTSFKPKLLHDLQSTVQHSVLDEPVAESVCIIADTDNWTVEVASSRLLDICSSGTMPWTTSQLVASLIESVLDLYRLKMSAEFCIMHLEDRLQEMYFKSLMLAEYIKGVQHHNQHQLSAMLGFDASDLPLLLAIAGTHTPNLALGV